MTRMRTSSDEFPDASPVGEHLVIDKREWVPGEHPEPHRREQGQQAYMEHYFRCLRCGVEVLRKRDLPQECDPARSE